MTNNTAARTTELREAAAKIVKAGGPYIARAALVRLLKIDTGCASSAAQRHIRAALGLIDPIGARAMRTPLPVQSITFRATKAEKEVIRPAVRQKINALLAELRAKTKSDEGHIPHPIAPRGGKERI